ncbi:MAG: hypothetical protein A3K19_10650 [Lentisphaerae bacterium RIFOXYB12_FULL_65_16]|nr:MAG: hypothetical protein A3K18_29800 [Lentisphaerae bacterium RIFOXYA12_64_32]OGV87912.1 MAG: hypothetical protein A3K19_10650 [Lentisphaerae bacterium RIFOXYB12_FULL_65_16]
MLISPLRLTLCSALTVCAFAGAAVAADAATDRKALACRAVEEYGRIYIGEPVASFAHTVTLFAVSKRPVPGEGSIQEHLDWVNNPLHTCIADGTGALSELAHPSPIQAAWIASLKGLTGMEIHYAGEAVSRDALWDDVLRRRIEKGDPLLWAFAADDTHSRERIGLSWYAALLPTVDEVALKKALRDGALYVSNGPVIQRVAVDGAKITLELGQASEVLWLRAGQFNAPETTFSGGTDMGKGKCLKQETGVTQSTFDISAVGVPVQELQFVRAIVRVAPTGEALTQPFVVKADGSIVNPYPASGTWVRGQMHNHSDGSIGARMNSDKPSISFRDAYRAKGMDASFELEYSYWEVPLGRPKSDGFPDLVSVAPNRVPAGSGSELRIEGVNFKHGVTVQLNDRPLEGVVVESETVLRVTLPADFAPGVYDLVVTNPNRFRSALCEGFTVQEPDATSAGWSTFTTPDLPWPQAINLAVIGDAVWVGTMYGAARFTAGKWEKLLPGDAIYGIVAMPDGSVGFAVANGLKFLDPNGQVQKASVGCGAKSERWGSLAFDPTGRLWAAGRWNNGLAIRSTTGIWTRWSKAEGGLPGDTCQAVTPDADGAMWVGFGSGVHKWTPSGGWQEVKGPDGMGRFPACVARGANGDMWAATHDAATGGVTCFRRDGTTQVFTAPPLPSTRVTAILPANDGSVWFASRRGAARLSPDGQWTTFTTRNSGLAWDHVLALAEDGRGQIWFATGRGVSVLAPVAGAP